MSGRDVAKAAHWYNRHLLGKLPIVILQGNKSRALEAEEGKHAGGNDTSPNNDKFNVGDEDEQLLDMLLNLGIDAPKPSTAGKAYNGQKRAVRVPPEGVTVTDPATYFKAFCSEDERVHSLVESLQLAKADKANDSADDKKAGRPHYAAHLQASAALSDIEEGRLLKGVIRMSRQGPRQAWVQCSDRNQAEQISVPSKMAINRAIHGDIVAVRLLPQAQWTHSTMLSPPGDEVIEEAAEEDRDSREWAGSEPGEEVKQVRGVTHRGLQSKRTPTAEVVAILSRSTSGIVVSLEESDGKGIQERRTAHRSEAALCVPLDRRMPKLRLRSSNLARLVGQRFVVRLIDWDQSSNYPACHFLHLLGPINDVRSEMDAILAKVGIEERPFSRGALEDLPTVADPFSWAPNQKDVNGRRELRGSEHLIFSIDPPGCTDVDDALSVRRLPNGSLQVGVHIADVSHFVKSRSLLDSEAQARGTTVYLVDRRLDMLPSLLSEHLCSLVGGRDRLAVSVVWTLGSDLEVQSTWFGRSVIRSRHQLEYKQAQDILDGRDTPASRQILAKERLEVQSGLDILNQLAAKRRSVRVKAGAMELESAELRFETSADGHTEMHSKELVPMMAVVAEMMILANSAVAERIMQTFPSHALLRRHQPPDLNAFSEIADLCKQGGASLDVSSSRALSHSLQAALRAATDNASAALIKSLATRAMSEAQYLPAGDGWIGAGGLGHFGLALQHYTHFTSPIRRYADVVVHRQLLAALEAAPAPPIKQSPLSSLSGKLNERNRQSKQAQRECHDFYFLTSLQSSPQVESALVYGVKPTGLLLYLPKYGIRSAVHLLDRAGLPKPPLETTEEPASDPIVFARRNKLELTTGDDWVRIVDKEYSKIVFETQAMQRVQVLLSAQESRSHGMSLCVNLLQNSKAHSQMREAGLPKPDLRTETKRIAASSNVSIVVKQHGYVLPPSASQTQPRPLDQSYASPSLSQPESIAQAVEQMAALFQRVPEVNLLEGETRSVDEQRALITSPGKLSSQPVTITEDWSKALVEGWHTQNAISRIKASLIRRRSCALESDIGKKLEGLARKLETV